MLAHQTPSTLRKGPKMICNNYDFCYTTAHEIEFLSRLRDNNRPAFETQCRIILNDQRGYGPGVNILTLKIFIRLEGGLNETV